MRSSFEYATQLFKQVESHAKSDVFCSLVGTKADLTQGDRKVSYDEGKQLAHKQGVPFFEVSSKLGTQIEESFYVLTEKIAKHKLLLNSLSKPSDGTTTSHPSNSIKLDRRSLFNRSTTDLSNNNDNTRDSNTMKLEI